MADKAEKLRLMARGRRKGAVVGEARMRNTGVTDRLFESPRKGRRPSRRRRD